MEDNDHSATLHHGESLAWSIFRNRKRGVPVDKAASSDHRVVHLLDEDFPMPSAVSRRLRHNALYKKLTTSENRPWHRVSAMKNSPAAAGSWEQALRWYGEMRREVHIEFGEQPSEINQNYLGIDDEMKSNIEQTKNTPIQPKHGKHASSSEKFLTKSASDVHVEARLNDSQRQVASALFEYEDHNDRKQVEYVESMFTSPTYSFKKRVRPIQDILHEALERFIAAKTIPEMEKKQQNSIPIASIHMWKMRADKVAKEKVHNDSISSLTDTSDDSESDTLQEKETKDSPELQHNKTKHQLDESEQIRNQALRDPQFNPFAWSFALSVSDIWRIALKDERYTEIGNRDKQYYGDLRLKATEEHADTTMKAQKSADPAAASLDKFGSLEQAASLVELGERGNITLYVEVDLSTLQKTHEQLQATLSDDSKIRVATSGSQEDVISVLADHRFKLAMAAVEFDDSQGSGHGIAAALGADRDLFAAAMAAKTAVTARLESKQQSRTRAGRVSRQQRPSTISIPDHGQADGGNVSQNGASASSLGLGNPSQHGHSVDNKQVLRALREQASFIQMRSAVHQEIVTAAPEFWAKFVQHKKQEANSVIVSGSQSLQNRRRPSSSKRSQRITKVTEQSNAMLKSLEQYTDFFHDLGIFLSDYWDHQEDGANDNYQSIKDGTKSYPRSLANARLSSARSTLPDNETAIMERRKSQASTSYAFLNHRRLTIEDVRFAALPDCRRRSDLLKKTIHEAKHRLALHEKIMEQVPAATATRLEWCAISSKWLRLRLSSKGIFGTLIYDENEPSVQIEYVFNDIARAKFLLLDHEMRLFVLLMFQEIFEHATYCLIRRMREELQELDQELRQYSQNTSNGGHDISPKMRTILNAKPSNISYASIRDAMVARLQSHLRTNTKKLVCRNSIDELFNSIVARTVVLTKALLDGGSIQSAEATVYSPERGILLNIEQQTTALQSSDKLHETNTDQIIQSPRTQLSVNTANKSQLHDGSSQKHSVLHVWSFGNIRHECMVIARVKQLGNFATYAKRSRQKTQCTNEKFHSTFFANSTPIPSTSESTTPLHNSFGNTSIAPTSTQSPAWTRRASNFSLGKLRNSRSSEHLRRLSISAKDTNRTRTSRLKEQKAKESLQHSASSHTIEQPILSHPRVLTAMKAGTRLQGMAQRFIERPNVTAQLLRAGHAETTYAAQTLAESWLKTLKPSAKGFKNQNKVKSRYVSTGEIGKSEDETVNLSISNIMSRTTSYDSIKMSHEINGSKLSNHQPMLSSAQLQSCEDTVKMKDTNDCTYSTRTKPAVIWPESLDDLTKIVPRQRWYTETPFSKDQQQISNRYDPLNVDDNEKISKASSTQLSNSRPLRSPLISRTNKASFTARSPKSFFDTSMDMLQAESASAAKQLAIARAATDRMIETFGENCSMALDKSSKLPCDAHDTPITESSPLVRTRSMNTDQVTISGINPSTRASKLYATRLADSCYHQTLAEMTTEDSLPQSARSGSRKQAEERSQLPEISTIKEDEGTQQTKQSHTSGMCVSSTYPTRQLRRASLANLETNSSDTFIDTTTSYFDTAPQIETSELVQSTPTNTHHTATRTQNSTAEILDIEEHTANLVIKAMAHFILPEVTRKRVIRAVNETTNGSVALKSSSASRQLDDPSIDAESVLHAWHELAWSLKACEHFSEMLGLAIEQTNRSVIHFQLHTNTDNPRKLVSIDPQHLPINMLPPTLFQELDERSLVMRPPPTVIEPPNSDAMLVLRNQAAPTTFLPELMEKYKHKQSQGTTGRSAQAANKLSDKKSSTGTSSMHNLLETPKDPLAVAVDEMFVEAGKALNKLRRHKHELETRTNAIALQRAWFDVESWIYETGNLLLEYTKRRYNKALPSESEQSNGETLYISRDTEKPPVPINDVISHLEYLLQVRDARRKVLLQPMSPNDTS